MNKDKGKKVELRLVEITFIDSEALPAWSYDKDLFDELHKLYCYGLLLQKGKHYTAISQGYHEQEGYLNVEKIPNGCILEIKDLKYE